MYRTWQPMTRSQNRTIPFISIYFGKRSIPFGEPKLAFSATMNSLRGDKLSFSDPMNSLRGAKLAFSATIRSLMGINTVLWEIIDSEVKTIFEDKRYCNSLGCHASEYADENSFLETDIKLNVLSYLSSDDKSLIQCDGNSTYMCDTSSSVNKKIYESVEIFAFFDHMYVRVAGSKVGNHPEWHLRWPNTVFARVFVDEIQRAHKGCKTNMPSIERSFYLLNTRTICAIFFYY